MAFRKTFSNTSDMYYLHIVIRNSQGTNTEGKVGWGAWLATQHEL